MYKIDVDNFDSIRKLLRFDDDGDSYYFIQIMQRKKDDMDISKNNRIIMNYYITSLDYLNDREEEIKTLCKIYNARAYISINPGSFRKSCQYAFKELADINISGQYRQIINLMPTLAGKYNNGGDSKLWIIDYDSKDDSHIGEIKEALRVAKGRDGEGVDKIKLTLPTKNGFHLIVTPYDPRATEALFRSFDFEVAVHKNNPTLLFAISKTECPPNIIKLPTRGADNFLLLQSDNCYSLEAEYPETIQVTYDKYNEIVSVDPVDGPVLMVDTKPDYIGRKIERMYIDEGKVFICFERLVPQNEWTTFGRPKPTDAGFVRGVARSLRRRTNTATQPQ